MLTIISGGQTGVDQKCLELAWLFRFPTGGVAPLGYRTDEGPMPELLRDKYGLEESWSPGYRIRTIENVKRSSATVWFGVESPGYRLTIGTCMALSRPYLINPSETELLSFLRPEILILNGAGNRRRTHPESAMRAEAILRPVLQALRAQAPQA